MSNEKSPIEGKVYAATVGSGAGATVAAFALWLLGVLVWHVPSTAERAGDAITAVPFPVNGLIVLLVTAGGAFVAGYVTKHTPRPLPESDGAVIVEQADTEPHLDSGPDDPTDAEILDAQALAELTTQADPSQERD